MNKGSTYEDNVETRNDICVIKHGLKIPIHAEHYIDFVERMNTNENEFRKALDTQGSVADMISDALGSLLGNK